MNRHRDDVEAGIWGLLILAILSFTVWGVWAWFHPELDGTWSTLDDSGEEFRISFDGEYLRMPGPETDSLRYRLVEAPRGDRLLATSSDDGWQLVGLVETDRDGLRERLLWCPPDATDFDDFDCLAMRRPDSSLLWQVFD